MMEEERRGRLMSLGRSNGRRCTRWGVNGDGRDKHTLRTRKKSERAVQASPGLVSFPPSKCSAPHPRLAPQYSLNTISKAERETHIQPRRPFPP